MQASAREKVVRLKANGENVAEWTTSVTNKFQSKFALPPFDVVQGHHLVNLGVINPANTFGATLVRKMDESIRPPNLTAFAEVVRTYMEGEKAEPGYVGEDDDREFKFADDLWEDNLVHKEQVEAWKLVLYQYAMSAHGDSFRGKILLPSASQAFDYVLSTLPEEMLSKISAKPGDIPTLRTEVNLALNRMDEYSPDTLSLKFLHCTMAGEGKGDLMKYLALMRSYRSRLERIGQAQSTSLSALLLLRGLDAVVFRTFIDLEETRVPRCASYEEMEEKIKKWSTTKAGSEALQQASKAHVFAVEVPERSRPSSQHGGTRTAKPIGGGSASQTVDHYFSSLMKACKANGVCMAWAKTNMCEDNERGVCTYHHSWRRNVHGSDSRAQRGSISATSAPSRQPRGRGRGGRAPAGRSSGGAQVFNVQDLDEGIFILDESHHDDSGYVSQTVDSEDDYEETHDVAMLTAEVESLISVSDSKDSSGLEMPPELLEFGGPPPLTGSDSDSDSGLEGTHDSTSLRQGVEPLEVQDSHPQAQDVPDSETDVAMRHLQFPEEVTVSHRRHQLAVDAEDCWIRASSLNLLSSKTSSTDLPVCFLPLGASSWMQPGSYRCELCEVTMNTPFSWWQHSTGARHRRAIDFCLDRSGGLTTRCDECGSYTTQPLHVHRAGARHKKRVEASNRPQASSSSSSSTSSNSPASDAASACPSTNGEVNRVEFYLDVERFLYDSYLNTRAGVMELVQAREEFNLASRKRLKTSSVPVPVTSETVLTLSQSELTNVGSDVPATRWILDSGATISCTFEESDCYDVLPCRVKVRAAGDQKFTVTSRGKLRIKCDRAKFDLPPSQLDSDVLGECLISSRFSRKILALQPLLRAGRTLTAKEDISVLVDAAGTPLLLAEPRGKLLVVLLLVEPSNQSEEGVYSSVLTSVVRPSRKDLVARILVGHLCFAHMNYKEVAHILKLPLPANMPVCFVCAIVSPRSEPHDNKSVREPEYVGQMWAMDSKGPYQVPGLRGELYDLVVTELMFGAVFLFPVVSITMDTCFQIWERIFKQHKANFNDRNKVVLLIHDQHLSFNNAMFAKHAAAEGYRQSNTAAYEHWMNPAERSIQVLITMKKKNILQANMPLILHSESGKHAAQAHNAGLPTGRCRSRVPADKKEWSRGELLQNRQTAEHGLRSLFPFGCLAVNATALELVRENFVPQGKMSCHLYYEPASHEYVLASLDGTEITASFRVRAFPTIFPRRLRSPCNIAALAYESSSALEAIQKEVHTRNDLEALVRHNPALLDPPRRPLAVEDLDAAAVPATPATQGPMPTVAPDAVVPYQSRRRGWNPSAKALANLERDFNVRELNQEGEEVQQFDSSPLSQPLNVQAISPSLKDESVYHLGASSRMDPIVQFEADPLLDKASPESAAGEMGPVTPDEPLTPDSLASMTPPDERSIMLATGLLGERMRGALLAEYRGLKKDGVLGPILRKGEFEEKPLGTRIVTRIKGNGYVRLADIPLASFRARLCARGDQSVAGEHHDPDHTAAMVARPESLRFICAMAVDENLHAHATADVQRAFRTPLIDKRVIIRLPRTFDPDGDGLRPIDSEPLYSLLRKGLEGLRQGSRLFYDEFKGALADAGLFPTKSDPCVFTNFKPVAPPVRPNSCPESIFFKGAERVAARNEFAGKVVALLHVDDLLVVAATEALKNALLVSLAKKYSLKISPLTTFLGLDFKVCFDSKGRSIFISQPEMARTILQRAGMADATPSPTPLLPGTIIDVPREAREEVSAVDKKRYRSVVMALNWLAYMTKPTLKYPVGKLSRHISDPAQEHILALKQVLRYLAGTIMKGIRFSWSPEDSEGRADSSAAYSDSSHVDDKITSKSTLAYVIFRARGPISWYSKLSALVPRSPQQSEFLALDALLLELVWLTELQKECGYTGPSQRDPDREAVCLLTVHLDSAGALSCLNDVIRHQANKHYRLRMIHL